MEKKTYTIDQFTTEEAFEVADLVITGRIASPGSDNPGGGGQVYYQGVRVTIVQIEKGSYNEADIVIDYQVRSMEDNHPAKKPTTGETYRFFIFIYNHSAFKISDV